MISVLADFLIVSSLMMLIAALNTVRRIVVHLPAGSLRNKWFVMTALIAIFVAGYLSYGIFFRDNRSEPLDLVVPGIFFAGGAFVWLTATLSFHTTLDVRRMGELEHENITDPLTGIYNRRYMERRLDEEVARSRRYGLPLAIYMIDVDYFKRVNDRYGHLAGDSVLAALGDLILNSLRQSDIAARYGGEEFLVIVPNTPVAAAGQLAERLRKSIESHAFLLPDPSGADRKCFITASIGVADLDHSLATGRGLIQAADEALYRAKGEGRNRVVINTSHVAGTASS